MDFNEDEVLISLRNMENSSSNQEIENGHTKIRHPSYPSTPKMMSLTWLELRVFYVRVSKYVIDDDSSTPEYLTLNHVPLNRNTLLEANGIRTSIYSDGVTILLKRDRLDRRSEEVTFVSTDSVRTTGSVKLDVFNKDFLVLSGTLDLCSNNGFVGDGKNQFWTMNCDQTDNISDGFLKGNQKNHYMGRESGCPAVEVCVAGCFSGSPIILTKSLELNHGRRKQPRKGMLESIPEYEEATRGRREDASSNGELTMKSGLYPEEDNYSNPHPGMEYLESEDGELTWFNAGVRVGVGIGLSICLGVGIGVGLLVRTYQGTARNFTRRLL